MVAGEWPEGVELKSESKGHAETGGGDGGSVPRGGACDSRANPLQFATYRWLRGSSPAKRAPPGDVLRPFLQTTFVTTLTLATGYCMAVHVR